MKKIMLGMLSIALLAGCSNDELLDAPQLGENRAIAFTNAFVDKPVKAGQEITTANLTDFSVFGYMRKDGTETPVKIFDNEVVTKQSDGTWAYANTQYWGTEKDYLFFAVGPYTTRNWQYVENRTNPELSTITFNNDGNNDLVMEKYILMQGFDPKTQGAVPLTFDHLLSRVKFAFTNSMDNALTTLQVVDVKVEDVRAKGIYNLQSETATPKVEPYWTNDGTTIPVVFGLTDKISRNDTKQTQYMYYIPTKDVAYTLSFSIQVYQSDVLSSTFPHTVTVPVMEYLPGHSYMFTADINAKNINPDDELHPIKFTVVKVEDWAADENKTITLPENNNP